MKTVGSRSISSQRPWRIASTIVAWPPRGGRSGFRSFLTAVDMLISRHFHRRLLRRQIEFIEIRQNLLEFLLIFAGRIDEGPILSAVHRNPNQAAFSLKNSVCRFYLRDHRNDGVDSTRVAYELGGRPTAR